MATDSGESQENASEFSSRNDPRLKSQISSKSQQRIIAFTFAKDHHRLTRQIFSG
jgi:hypothetical protein